MKRTKPGKSACYESTDSKTRSCRPELMWHGKYDNCGGIIGPPATQYPLKTTELFPSPSTLSLADPQTDSQTNKLICGNNLRVIPSIMAEYAGKIDLIYIDPPFATGSYFSLRASVGNSPINKESNTQIPVLAYQDRRSNGESGTLAIFAHQLMLMRELLSARGMILVHFDDNIGHEAKLILDEVFGEKNFRGEIVWQLGNGGKSKKFFSIQHNIILAYSKTDTWTFNTDDPIVREPYADTSLDMHFKNVDENGKRYRKRYLVEKSISITPTGDD